MKERRKEYRRRNKRFFIAAAALMLVGAVLLWGASLKIPDLSDLSERKIAQSTKIYDRTGQVLLYDMSQDVRRTVIPFNEISESAKKATLAIEDHNFYQHGGIEPSSILRAFFVNLATFSFSQGGSTITQQVVKNTILTNDKSAARKIKELILAEKLDKTLSKDQILDIYLNEIPFGGSIYGIEEASQSFYGKSAKDLSLAESAYLASLIKAPTYYSPYGLHKADLEARKNLVLHEMLNYNFITQADYDKAVKEVVTFRPKETNTGIKAPHFVFFVINYLVDKYGEDALARGGLKVTTTLDYGIEKNAESLAEKYGDINQKTFNASNNAIVVLDPKTGDILSMVGSRNYFDNVIGGNFNVATSHRQPGSTFKPFVYSVLFNKGYTPSTILFDVPTQFSTACPVNNFEDGDPCYSPEDYDHKFRGPMTIRDALAQSINVPAVKALYLAGVKNSIDLAHQMGITSLNEPDRYGLTLVLGGGEVSLLDLTSAYTVFANDGNRVPYRAILKVEDQSGEVLEEGDVVSTPVLPPQTARDISSILSDNVAKEPSYGIGSPLYFYDRPVASKTGTTNDSRDAWVIGYAPNVAVGVWAGNNDNSPMVKKVAGLIAAPLWRAVMDTILPNLPPEAFNPPAPVDQGLKPVLAGNWQAEYSMGGLHSILYWVNKNDPLGPPPANPASDPQFAYWEYGVKNWADTHTYVPPPEPLVPIQTTPTPIQIIYPTTPVPTPPPGF